MSDLFNFSDVFKNNFLESGAINEVTIIGITKTIIIAFLVGLLIFFTYKKFYKGVVYSYSFNTSLILLVLITAMIIMTISSNIVLSLGMVGALSIVRFRTAIKDPMDLVFLFWSIAAGIGVGAGIYDISIICSLLIALTIIMLNKFKDNGRIYLLIIHYNEEGSDGVKKIISRLNYILRNKTVRNGKTELTLEMKIKKGNTAFVDDLSSISGVDNVVLVSYNGDFAE